ncbi:MAG TPA: hypothetical protein VJY33_17650 [Isosphaeraceae bacterium]|nr:hypothetical protein [Isosphaeraceae bacterium]
MLSNLLQLVFLVGTIVTLVRFIAAPILGGKNGIATAFVAHAVLWPFRVALAILRALAKHLLDSRRHRIRLPRERRSSSWLASAARRYAARNARTPAGQYVAIDEADRRPGAAPADYPADEFEELWQRHLRSLRGDDPYDEPDELLVNVGAVRHAWELR